MIFSIQMNSIFLLFFHNLLLLFVIFTVKQKTKKKKPFLYYRYTSFVRVKMDEKLKKESIEVELKSVANKKTNKTQ